MTYEYSDSIREADEHVLPDIEVFKLTAEEVAERLDEDTAYEYLKSFPLAHMNSRDRQAMIDAIIAGECLTGGWFYWYCFPGCLPDSEPYGPFDSYAAALEDARDSCSL
jgi:hypothetical protein